VAGVVITKLVLERYLLSLKKLDEKIKARITFSSDWVLVGSGRTLMPD
jgi:hypothetical protein